MEKKSFINSSNSLQRIVSRMSKLWCQFERSRERLQSTHLDYARCDILF